MRFLRRHPLALVVLAGLLAGGLAIAAASAPDNQAPEDFHGRTWLTATADSGEQLVLVNGISGLIEGRSQGGATIPDGAQFIDSTATSTLVGSSEGATVVNSGTQAAVTKTGVDATRSALTDDLVVTVGRNVRVLPKSLAGSGRTLEGAPTPLAGLPPVVDDAGDAWYLGRSGNERVAVELSGAGPTVESHAVDRSTSRLLVVDGDVYATGPKAIDQVEGDGSRTVAARSDVLPSVAVASGELWASASGRTITIFGDGSDERTVRAGAEVVDLAVWNGDVVAATTEGAERIAGDEAEPIEAIRSRPSVHADGGMLWLTSKTDVVAIDRDQQESHFRLAALDADLCIDSCDAGDIAQLLEDQPTPTTQPGDETTTTTAPPRDLQPPDTEPELPTTTTTTTPPTTTEAPAPDTTVDRPPRSTTTTSEPKTTTTTVKPPSTVRPPVPPSPTRPVTPSTRRPTPTTSRPTPTFPTRPTRPTPPPQTTTTTQPPPQTTATTTTRPSTTTTTEATTTTTTQPPVSYGLTLNLVPADTSAEATVSVVGPARPCAPFGSTGGTVTWSGAGQGSQQVALRWRGGNESESANVTIPNLQAGELQVRFEACGVRTTASTTIKGPPPPPTPPTVGQITVDGAVKHGDQFKPYLQYQLNGWTVADINWNGNGDSCTTDDATREYNDVVTAQVFTANKPGPCQMTVVMTFRSPDGSPDQQENRQGQIDVATTAAG